MSHKTITGILRDKLRFQKLVFSDALEMKAISDHYGADEAAILSVAAGCDVLIYRGLPEHFHLADCIANKEIPKNLAGGEDLA